MNLKYLILLQLFLFVSSSFFANSDPVTPEEKEACQKIFRKLKEAKGILPSQPPNLVIKEKLPDTRFLLAMAETENKVITIQTSVLQLCRDSLGDMAEEGLAYLLAHELAHVTREHYVRHQYIRQFEQGVAQDTGFKRILKLQASDDASKMDAWLKEYKAIEHSYQIRKNEAEADLEAGFTCYLAGYNIHKAGPLFLDKAYTHFGINPKGGDYASKEDRQQIIRQMTGQLDSLIKVYETANLLAISDFSKEAIQCYDFVSKLYPSKELFNNAGVLGLTEIAKDISVRKLKYALPLSMDLLEFEIEDQKDILTDEEFQRFMKELNVEFKRKLEVLVQSIRYFDKSSQMDHLYHLGELNKSIAYVLIHFLKSKYEDVQKYKEDDLAFAEAAALKAKQIVMNNPAASAKEQSDVFNMLAVIRKYQFEDDKAEQLLKKALELLPTNQLALVNQKIFEGDEEEIRKVVNFTGPTFSLCGEEELLFESKTSAEVEQENINTWDVDYTIDSRIIKPSISKTNTVVKYASNESFELYKFSKIKGSRVKQDIQFFKTKIGYSFSTICDIDRDSVRDDILDEYGSPLKTIQSKNGSILHYDGILFYLNEGNEVVDWVVYSKLK